MLEDSADTKDERTVEVTSVVELSEVDEVSDTVVVDLEDELEEPKVDSASDTEELRLSRVALVEVTEEVTVVDEEDKTGDAELN